MTVRRAHRIRRGAFVLAAIAATLLAHVLAVGPISLSTRAALICAVPVALAAARAPGRPVVVRGPVVIGARLVAAQLACHAALALDPGVFGITMHAHAGSTFTAAAVAVHVGVGLQLALLLAVADRLLASAMRVAARVRRALTLPVRRVRAHPWLRVADREVRWISRHRPAHRGRGPPRIAPR